MRNLEAFINMIRDGFEKRIRTLDGNGLEASLRKRNLWESSQTLLLAEVAYQLIELNRQISEQNARAEGNL